MKHWKIIIILIIALSLLTACNRNESNIGFGIYVENAEDFDGYIYYDISSKPYGAYNSFRIVSWNAAASAGDSLMIINMSRLPKKAYDKIDSIITVYNARL